MSVSSSPFRIFKMTHVMLASLPEQNENKVTDLHLEWEDKKRKGRGR